MRDANSSLSLTEALARRRTTRHFGPGSISADAVAAVLSVVTAATDDAGHRAAPSAHERYPITALVATGDVAGLAAGVWQAEGPARSWALRHRGDVRAAVAEAAIGDQPWVGQAGAIATLCADIEDSCRAFADQPPAGARGARYLWMEAGAIAQNMALIAADQGLGAVLVAGFNDASTGRALGLAGREQALLHLCLGPLPDAA